MTKFQERFKNRLSRIANTIKPNSTSGETVIDSGILSFKNSAADWRIDPNGRVEVRLHAVSSLNFSEPNANESPWMPCRAFRSAGSLIGSLVDSALKDRSVEMMDGRRVPFLIEGSMELRPEIREWIVSNARVLIALIAIPSKAQIKEQQDPQGAFEYRKRELQIVVDATRSATDRAGILKHKIAVELLLGLESNRSEQQ